jgi:hypothetical protein
LIVEFENRFVPEKDQNNPKYAGYSFAMLYREIERRLRGLRLRR